MNQPAPNSFLGTLQKHRSGGLLAEASAKLAELTAAVHATGKRGKMTILLEVNPAQAGDQCVTLHDDIVVKIPKTKSPASLWYTTAEGDLLKNNPRQMEIAPVVVAAESRLSQVGQFGTTTSPES